MFLQVLQGTVGDARALREQLDSWVQDHAAHAEGWLGTTAGITEDGEFIAVVRFESTEAARRNSDRDEQGKWWSETERHFEGPVQFHDYPNAAEFLDGGSDDAGFVQVIQGRSSDVERLITLERDLEQSLRELRPDLIGGTYGWDDQGHMTQTAYFTSEAEAREGEQGEFAAPENVQRANEQYRELVTDLRYFDLRNPWLRSAQ